MAEHVCWSLGNVEDMVTIAKDDSVKDETKQALVKKKIQINLKNFLGKCLEKIRLCSLRVAD